jgi:hypothetical protein
MLGWVPDYHDLGGDMMDRGVCEVSWCRVRFEQVI